jgi:DNA-binding MarR family transcriptional regulator
LTMVAQATNIVCMSKDLTPHGAARGAAAASGSGLPPEPGPCFYEVERYCSEDSVGYLMRRVMLSLINEVDRRLESEGLTHVQWTPLYMLYKGKASTLAELARELQIDPGALTRTLDRLEAKGLCRRVRSTEDRRVSKLELTETGLAAAAQVPAVLSSVQNAYLKGFTHDEWQQLLDMLRRLSANADTMKANELAANQGGSQRAHARGHHGKTSAGDSEE